MSGNAPTSAFPMESTEKRNGKTRRTILTIIAALSLLLGFFYGVPFLLHSLSYVSTDDAFLETDVVWISAKVPSYVLRVLVHDNQPVSEGDLLAELDPRDYETRLNEAKAALEAAHAAQKSKVIQVDLTTIHSSAELTEAEANLRTSRAAIESASAQAQVAASELEETRAHLASTQNILAQIQAEVDSAEAQQKRDHSDFLRYQEMAKSKDVTEQQLDHARTTERMSSATLEATKRKVATEEASVHEAEAAVKAAQDTLHQARAQIAVRTAEAEESEARLSSTRSAPQQVSSSQAEADAAEAAVHQAEADVRQAELDLSYTRIVAPCAGHITKKSLEPGAYAQEGQSLMAIVCPDMWVVANFKETQLTQMKRGQSALIHVDTYPGVTFKGHVGSFQRGTGSRFSLLPAENATGNYVKVVQRIPVKILFDPSETLHDYMLAPGMSVVPEVHITEEGTESTLPNSRNFE